VNFKPGLISPILNPSGSRMSSADRAGLLSSKPIRTDPLLFRHRTRLSWAPVRRILEACCRRGVSHSLTLTYSLSHHSHASSYHPLYQLSANLWRDGRDRQSRRRRTMSIVCSAFDFKRHYPSFPPLESRLSSWGIAAESKLHIVQTAKETGNLMGIAAYMGVYTLP